MAASQHTVLVVDDEPASVRAVRRALAEENRVLTAGSGPEGLRLLAAERVALIVADHRMPEMTGTEFLAESAARCPDTIRVLLTGYTDVDTVIGAINAGHVYYYLTKPWEPRELKLVVRRGFERFDAEAERQRLLRELQQACDRIRREVEQKTRLLTMAAHELGTPLHVLLNALALLATIELPPRAQAWLRTAQRNADWLGRGLAQMTAAARSRSDGIRLRPAALRLADLWASLYQELRAHLGERRLELVAEVNDDLPAIEADRFWLRHALAGVVSNAIRFTPDGGRVSVSARPDAAGKQIAVTVRDTGIGIPAAQLAEIFEPFSAAGGDPFQHASGSLAFGARGLGLGLSIARAIVALHGGSIVAESQPQRGSCFTLLLPMHRRAAARDDFE
jgi:signal transduction histidine kinase